MYKKEKVIKKKGKTTKTFVHVAREGDDIRLYSLERSNKKTWKKPCPLNLKWDDVLKSKEDQELALKMMLRDEADRKKLNLTKFNSWGLKKIEWLKSKIAKR